MDEIKPVQNIQNLDAHYTTSPKVEIPQHVVVQGPETIPQYHIYTDREANIKLETLNNDVYEAVQKTPKKNKKKFLGIF